MSNVRQLMGDYVGLDDTTKELIKNRLREFEALGRHAPRPSVLEYKDWADRAFSLMNYGRRIPWSYEIAGAHEFIAGFVADTDQEGFRLAKNAAARIYDYLEGQLVSSGTGSTDGTIHVDGEALMPTQRVLDKKVFIVHGHDEAKKWELKNFLAALGVEPLVLHEQDDLGKTIIEKFEHYAAQCSFAFVLMTPDDQHLASDPKEQAWRARQNVIMELGWFMTKLGRDRVIILHKGAVEIPSDILGVIYLPFQHQVTEVGEKIRQRLKGAGLIA